MGKILNVLKKIANVYLAIFLVLCVPTGIYFAIKDIERRIENKKAKESFQCDLSANVTDTLGYKPRYPGFNVRDFYVDHLMRTDSLQYLNSFEITPRLGAVRTLKTVCIPKQSIMNYCESNWNMVKRRLQFVNKSFPNCSAALNDVLSGIPPWHYLYKPQHQGGESSGDNSK